MLQLQLQGSLRCGLPGTTTPNASTTSRRVSFLSGKRRSRPMGAGPARSSVISVPHPTKLAMVSVNVAQVGDVHAMVDSGAMVSGVRKDIVESILKEENKFGGHVVGFDKIKVPVVGEMALSVRFEGVAAELKRVKIVENSLYDMILGAEWLEKGRIIVYAEDGRLTAHVRPHGLDLSLKKLDTSEPPIQDSCAAVSISMVPGLSRMTISKTIHF